MESNKLSRLGYSAKIGVFFSLPLFVAFSIFENDGIACAQESGNDKETVQLSEQQARSFLQALAANNQAIDRFDVLYTREFVNPRPDAKLSIFKSRTRVLHDRQTNAGIVVRAIQMDDFREEAPRAYKKVFAVLRTESGEAFLRESDAIRKIPNPSMGYVRRLVHWPTFSTLGLESFPDYLTDDQGSLFWKRALLGGHELSASPTAGGKTVVRLITENPRGGDAVDYKWIFDERTLMPTVIEGALTFSSNGKRVVTERTRIEWRELEGILVPETIHKSLLQFANSNGIRTRYEQFDDTTFDWKEINANWGESRFTLASFEQLEPSVFLGFDEENEN